jgi:hypothetical protein
MRAFDRNLIRGGLSGFIQLYVTPGRERDGTPRVCPCALSDGRVPGLRLVGKVNHNRAVLEDIAATILQCLAPQVAARRR